MNLPRTSGLGDRLAMAGPSASLQSKAPNGKTSAPAARFTSISQFTKTAYIFGSRLTSRTNHRNFDKRPLLSDPKEPCRSRQGFGYPLHWRHSRVTNGLTLTVLHHRR